MNTLVKKYKKSNKIKSKKINKFISRKNNKVKSKKINKKYARGKRQFAKVFVKKPALDYKTITFDDLVKKFDNTIFPIDESIYVRITITGENQQDIDTYEGELINLVPNSPNEYVNNKLHTSYEYINHEITIKNYENNYETIKYYADGTYSYDFEIGTIRGVEKVSREKSTPRPPEPKKRRLGDQ